MGRQKDINDDYKSKFNILQSPKWKETKNQKNEKESFDGGKLPVKNSYLTDYWRS